MVRVMVDLSDATDTEIALFYSLPGVGRALDVLAHDHELVALTLRPPPLPASAVEFRA